MKNSHRVSKREIAAWDRMDSDPSYDPDEIVDAAYDEYADMAGYYEKRKQADENSANTWRVTMGIAKTGEIAR